MRIEWMALVAATGLLACNTSNDDADMAAGAVKSVKQDPSKIDVKDIDKVFDMEESKPAELKPAEILTPTDIKAKSPGGMPVKGLVTPTDVKAKSPGANPGSPDSILTPTD